MKNAIKTLGITALVAVIGFLMAACATSSTSTTSNTVGTAQISKFEGKWTNEAALKYYGFKEFSFTFVGNEMIFYSVDSNSMEISQPGTFTYTDTQITFKPKQGSNWQGYTQGYTLSGNSLVLADDGWHNHGEFIKQ
jgi:hypothetical protein